MARPLFTPEELEELRRFDEELEEDFCQTPEEIAQSRKRDRAATVAAMDPEKRKIAERNAAWRKANREKWNAYWREYRRRKREQAASAE